ncbi:MAG TPA: protein translocase subunit SecD [Jiangellaceae bacterium]|nr:protein translocase subunit SecD [Jiangellaceae bacterium]
MKSPAIVRAVLAFLVLVASGYVTLTASPNLGLDLRGGTQMVLETQPTEQLEATSERTDQALEVLRRRVDDLGVTEPTITRSGERQIVIELPDVTDPTEARERLGATAQLTFHPVLGYAEQQAPEGDQQGTEPPGQSEPNPEQTNGAPAPGAASQSAVTTASYTAGDQPAPDQTGGQTEGQTGTPEQEPPPSPGSGDETSEDALTLPDQQGNQIRLGPSAMTGESVNSADAVNDPQQFPGGWAVSLNFNGEGAATWAELTGQAACYSEGDPRRQVAIVLDDEIISNPQVNPDIQCNVGITGGQTSITGGTGDAAFTEESTNTLAALIEGGGLPLPVEIIEQRTVGPTLGADAIEASAQAAVIGLILTGLFIIVTYRLVGVMAVLALVGYAVISFAVLVGLGATLTLPGLAGFVLAIGMAVDANVLVFERAREEYAAQTRHSLRKSVQNGFRQAFSAIADSNVTTLLAAGLLFFLATGPVRGFGVTLSIGVLASMFSALVVSRALSEWAVNRGWVRNHAGITGIDRIGPVRARLENVRKNLMARPGRWLLVSGAIVVLSVGGIAIRGLDFGFEFTGGRLIAVSTEQTVDVDTAREAVADAGFPNAVVQSSGENEITVRTDELTQQEADSIEQAIGGAGGGGELVRDESVSASLGATLLRNAAIAFGVALAAQLAYLAIRFRWTYGTGAVIALFQNVAVVLGIFAWTGKSIDGIFLAAMLTIIGYTVNDSVVVFDRVRENRRLRGEEPFSVVASSSVLQTLPRTVNTGISTMIVLVALYVLGGSSLTDFSLALIVGIVIGTYSSNFTATPFAVMAENRWPKLPDDDEDEDALARAKGDRDDPGYGAIV